MKPVILPPLFLSILLLAACAGPATPVQESAEQDTLSVASGTDGATDAPEEPRVYTSSVFVDDQVPMYEKYDLLDLGDQIEMVPTPFDPSLTAVELARQNLLEYPAFVELVEDDYPEIRDWVRQHSFYSNYQELHDGRPPEFLIAEFDMNDDGRMDYIVNWAAASVSFTSLYEIVVYWEDGGPDIYPCTTGYGLGILKTKTNGMYDLANATNYYNVRQCFNGEAYEPEAGVPVGGGVSNLTATEVERDGRRWLYDPKATFMNFTDQTQSFYYVAAREHFATDEAGVPLKFTLPPMSKATVPIWIEDWNEDLRIGDYGIILHNVD